MKIENHIREILQLHEYAMSIGKSLDYEASCDQFLKLLLKRKNFNAAWIIEISDSTFKTSYAIPKGENSNSFLVKKVIELLNSINNSILTADYKTISLVAPIKIEKGNTAIFNLNEQVFLFIYSKKDNISNKDIAQLQPIMNKFSTHLKACNAFNEQEMLLHNLEVQNQELNDYAHIVSHDLKSPLRSIDALINWMQEDYNEILDEKGKENFELINQHLEKMDNLIDGILRYSSIDKNAGNEELIDLNKLIKEITSILPIPDYIEIEYKDLPKIKADYFKIQQLFQNLICNAAGSIKKEKGLVQVISEDKGDYWLFSIKDNGKGIEKRYFDKIFEVFQKLETNSNSTGIGLSIVKKVVNFYKGRIWLESELNKGTTFYFTFEKK